MRVMLVEDDPLLGDGVTEGLKHAGHVVEWLQDGIAAETGLAGDDYDAVVLDLGLPGQSGLQVLARLRDRGSEVPVLILTARDAITDRVAGLDAGADDYLVKPFDLDELLARLRALQRRHGGRSRPQLLHGGIELDPASRIVTFQGETVTLSRREYSLLLLLLEHRGRVIPRNRIEKSLYAWNETVESNAVEVHVHNLRRKFGNALIRTVRGVGYIIDDPQ